MPPLDRSTYRPRGTTALLDAVGKTVDDVGHRPANMAEEKRFDKVIVAIFTDGAESSSNKYKLSQVKEKITHQKAVYKWDFIFLAANQDAFQEALKLGIDTKDAFNFEATETGGSKCIFEYERQCG